MKSLVKRTPFHGTGHAGSVETALLRLITEEGTTPSSRSASCMAAAHMSTGRGGGNWDYSRVLYSGVPQLH